MGAARSVVEDEVLNLVTKVAEGGGSRGTGEAGADDDHLVLPLVGGIDEFDVGLVLAPLVGEGTGGNFGFERGHARRALERLRF